MKHLNLRGAADKIGCTLAVVKRFALAGLLTDYRERREGVKKHYPAFAVGQVAKIAKVYRPSMSPDAVKTILDLTEKHAEKLTNGSLGHNPYLEQMQPKSVTADGVLARLDRIEKALNTLVAMWS